MPRSPGTCGSASSPLIYDDNHITIDGDTALTFSEDVGRRFEAYGWHVVKVGDGNDLAAIAAALEAARAETDRPTLVVLRTYIADPAPTKRNTAEAHGAPLGAEEVQRTKEIMGWPQEPTFFMPGRRAGALARRGGPGREALEAEWRAALSGLRRGSRRARRGARAVALGHASRGMGPRLCRS